MSRLSYKFKLSRGFSILLCLLVMIAAVGTFISVRKSPQHQQDQRGRLAHTAISSYVDNAVLKTLEKLNADAGEMHRAAIALQADPQTATMDATVAAWENVFSTWYQSVAFLYGPAAHYDYWKQIASWPCEKMLIEHALSGMKQGDPDVTSESLRGKQTATLRGVFTLQYLLFRNGVPRDVLTLSDEELVYLTATTQALLEESTDFEAAWRGTVNMSPEKLAILQAAGFREKANFAEEFKNPGTPSNRYHSLSGPLQDILQDLVSSLTDEVVPRLEELMDYSATEPVAYWDPIDPYTDIANLLQGVENAYMGGVPGERHCSMGDLVAAHDPALDRLLKISFAHSAYRVKALHAVRNESKEVRELTNRIAAAELAKLVARLTIAVPQLVLDPAVEPYAAYN